MQSAPVVWVTGSGAPRVGRVVAEYFAEQGYRIALHAFHSSDQADQCAQEWKERGITSIVTQSAIDDEEAVHRNVAEIVAEFGQLDALVHCAAIWDWKDLEQTTAEDVRKQLEVNTLGSFLCAKAAGLQMVRQSTGGSITLIGDWAVQRPYLQFSAYFVGKGAIETMTRSLAVELATRNPMIRVNAVLPGPVMLDERVSSERAERIRNASLLKRHGSPQHIAQATYFLATHEFITGVSLPVDGGRSIWANEGTDAVAHPTFPE